MELPIIDSERFSGLDVTLLGLIGTIVGWYGRTLSVPANTSPDLIRFFSVSPDRTYVAVMPQDKALLLLADPSTGGSARRVGTETAGSLDGVWTVVALVGVLLLFAGPAIAWANRD